MSFFLSTEITIRSGVSGKFKILELRKQGFALQIKKKEDLNQGVSSNGGERAYVDLLLR